MAGTALHLVPYALVAAASPLGLAAAVAVMRSGRVKAVAFAAGVVAGQLAACGLLVLIGEVAIPSPGSHSTLAALLEIVLGLGLLVLAVVLRSRPERADRASPQRSQALLERLEQVHALTALAVGALLGVGGPKRLVLTAFAAATIAASGDRGSNTVGLVLWYGLLATVVVWVPVLGYLLLGERAAARLDAGFAWVAARRRTLSFWTLVLIGFVLVGDGIAGTLGGW